jgi:hypothetical protein
MTYGRPPSNNEAKITIQVNNIEIESKDSDIQINIKNFRLEN